MTIFGIDNTTSNPNPVHDVTDQEKLFGYFAYRLDQTSRVTLLLSSSYSDFQIPNTPGLTPTYSPDRRGTGQFLHH